VIPITIAAAPWHRTARNAAPAASSDAVNFGTLGANARAFSVRHCRFAILVAWPAVLLGRSSFPFPNRHLPPFIGWVSLARGFYAKLPRSALLLPVISVTLFHTLGIAYSKDRSDSGSCDFRTWAFPRRMAITLYDRGCDLACRHTLPYCFMSPSDRAPIRCAHWLPTGLGRRGPIHCRGRLSRHGALELRRSAIVGGRARRLMALPFPMAAALLRYVAAQTSVQAILLVQLSCCYVSRSSVRALSACAWRSHHFLPAAWALRHR
jgi:hypothetical protein